MPYRLVTTFRPLAFIGCGISLWGAVDADKATAWIGAIAALGAVLVPTLIDTYRKVRRAAREELVADKELYAAEVRRRAELEVVARDYKARLATLEAEVAKLRAGVRAITPDPDIAKP